ncbi:MAG: HAMP domain-containing protein [Gammaproteobacteria bacterium]|nr:HAMP domain-containing protein [Gammaproteobacteria bacterium]MCW8988448.1 HAMP domain-containing protein [Gammaproteobacteria bacterium]MCW9031794.1 HAMP domain-containing protein [Gammaproteobacteria bacterium]
MVNLRRFFTFYLARQARLKAYLYARLIPKHFPIAYKLAVIMTLLISSGMILLGMVIVSNQTSLLQKQMNHFADTVVEQLADNSKELVMSDDILSLMVVISNLGAQDNILGAVIYSDDGKILASSGIIPSDEIYRLYNRSSEDKNKKDHFQLQWKTQSIEGHTLGATSYITPIKFQNIVAGHALITFSTAEIEQTVLEMIQAIIAATIIMIILGVFVSLHMGRRISKPLHSLMDASREISNGNYQYQIKERRNDELGNLTEALNRMADGLLEKTQVENAFSRYVSKNIAKEIMGNLEHIQLGGHHVEGSVIFADIVGFTELSEKHPAEKITSILNDYFSYISLASKMYQGTIDKYMGDCAMIVFGVPEQDKLHKLHAVYCAVMIQKLVERINNIRRNSNQLAVTFRIGINSGMMLAGNLGSTERMQYTVVGESVNLASRLQSIAKENQIIVSREFYDDPDIQWRLTAKEHKSIHLRGIQEEVSTYIVTDVIALYQDKMNEQIDEILRIKPAA